jgi:transposase
MSELRTQTERRADAFLAVTLAITSRWNNGPMEGHINRLKTIKRQMYGRAGFELLKSRVLPWDFPAAA